VRHPLTASKYSSNLARSRPPNASRNSLHHGLQVHLQPRSITPCEFAQSWPQNASGNSLDHGLEVSTIMASKWYASKLAWSRPPSVTLTWLHYGLQVRTGMASWCISKLAWSRCRSASLSSLDHDLEGYLQIRLITASKFISTLARSRPQSISLSSLDRHSQAHRALLSSTACSQSRYSVCRWVAI